MKAAEARTKKMLAKEVQTALPQFQANGRLLFLTPVKYLLRGVMLDASGFSENAFYPTAFVQPLYSGAEHIFFTFGGRLHHAENSRGWNIGETDWPVLLVRLISVVERQALPFLERIKEPGDLASACSSSKEFTSYFRWVSDDIHVMETAAHSWLLAGNTRNCLQYLQRIQHIITSGTDRRDWVVELNERARRLEGMLIGGKEDIARQELYVAAMHSAEALGLSPWASIPEL